MIRKAMVAARTKAARTKAARTKAAKILTTAQEKDLVLDWNAIGPQGDKGDQGNTGNTGAGLSGEFLSIAFGGGGSAFSARRCSPNGSSYAQVLRGGAGDDIDWVHLGCR